MATTTNYGWTTPDDTGLVKDGAAAIRTLGSSVDTTTKALNPSTTLGDIEYRSSTANTNTRLGIGTTGQVLTVSGGVPAWSTSSANSLTSLETGSLSGASVTTGTLSGSYRSLYVTISDLLPATDATGLRLRFNGDSNTRYNFTTSNGDTSVFDETSIGVTAASIDNGASDSLIVMTVPEYANTTTWKYIDIVGIHNNSTTPTQVVYTRRYGFYNQTSAITSLTFFMSSGNFTSGTYTVYGVK
jgi:hypothetical protein